MDPYTGDVLGERVFGAVRLDRHHLMSFIYELHVSLHLGEVMVWILGLVAFAWIFGQFAGVVLA